MIGCRVIGAQYRLQPGRVALCARIRQSVSSRNAVADTGNIGQGPSRVNPWRQGSAKRQNHCDSAFEEGSHVVTFLLFVRFCCYWTAAKIKSATSRGKAQAEMRP